MNPEHFVYTGIETEDARLPQDLPENTCNWKISYSIVRTHQQNVMLQQKYSYLLYTRTEKLQKPCPADMKILKHITRVDTVVAKLKRDKSDFDFEEYEALSGEYVSEVEQLELPKLSTWDEYRKLVEAAALRPQIPRSPLMEFTTLPKIRIIRDKFKKSPHPYARAEKSIIKMGFQKTILIADCTYIQFRNFELKKFYKKTITLKNVSTLPAKFRIEPRPYRSKFRVIINRKEIDRNIVPPGLQFQLIILFRCDEIDEPHEVLVMKVEHGKPLYIKLHGYNEPPILLGTCQLTKRFRDYMETRRTKFTIDNFQPDSSSSDSSESSDESAMYSMDSWDTIHNKFISMTFDCKRGFVGEKIYVPLKLKNTGGDGKFFVMSEIDWASMYIQDVTDMNMLKLPCFTIWPAYFVMKSQDEMIFHTLFAPEYYGVHVDKIYILCNNCTILATEITGDGVIYESQFIQISKTLKKDPSGWNLDERADYQLEINTSAPDMTGESTISVTNTSEIDIYFKWLKRTIQSDEIEIYDQNHFPLEDLRIEPDRGVLTSSSVHQFSVIAEYTNVPPNLYFAVLQLYVEDIPEKAVTKKHKMRVKQSTNRKRNCSNSVDVWVADVEVWLRYTEHDQFKSDEAFDDIAGRAIEIPEYEDFMEDKYEETDTEESKDDEDSSSQLLVDEMFLHYDIVNLKQFKPLWWERVISMGIIRPTRTLYIGIEETCTLTVKNLSENALIYSWGEANGEDAEKLQLCVCPEKGEVPKGNAQKMKITLKPIKEGAVQSLHIPCFVGDSQKIIVLGIECYIEPLYVTFYFPLSDNEPVELKNNFVQVEWRVDSLQLALDLAGRNKKGMKLLEKYRTREEKELMNADLDQGDVLKDASAGPSISEEGAEGSREQSILSTGTSELIQFSNLGTEDTKKVASTEDIVPFFQRTLPSIQQPVVMEFLNLPLRTVKKKTFIIKNETSIPTDFQLRLNNFYPVMCSCEGRSLKHRIKSIYKRVHCRQQDLTEEIMYRVKQPESGIVIYLDPLNSNIGPFKSVPVNIYAFGDTWGIYVDKLEINVRGLPLYTLEICVQIVGSPVRLSLLDKNQSKTPVLKLGTTMKGVRLYNRKIVLKNTSIVPIAIDWNSFIMKPCIPKKMPFNFVLDVCTSLTDELAAKLRGRKSSKASETDIKHESCCRRATESNSEEISINSDDITISTYSEPSNMAVSWSNDESEGNFEVSEDAYKSYVATTKSICDLKHTKPPCECKTNRHENARKIKDTEFKFSIIPYYGPIDINACTVTPREMFILPNDIAYLTIQIQPCKYIEKIKKQFDVEFLCKILGFLRIAPSDKYRDNYYYRPDGNYFPPVEIDVTANIIQPQLTFNITKMERTFVCCAHDVMQNAEKKLKLLKTFLLYNHGSETVSVQLEVSRPFFVESVSIYAESNPCKQTGNICINAKGCMETQILCIVDAILIETIIHTSRSQDLYDSVITITEPLQIVHTDKHRQDIELILQVWLPMLKLSSYTLHFNLVYVGDTKKLTLLITNLSICSQYITINQKFKNKDFKIDHKDGKLSKYSCRRNNCFILTVSFQPKKPGQSIEILEITTGIPYTTEECEICGEGTLDEKYHTPGV